MSYPETMNAETAVESEDVLDLEEVRTNDLTVMDRCDTCGAQAYVEATLRVGSPLLFCAHHHRKAEVRLAELGAKIKDETYKLYELPSRLQGED